MSRYKPGLDDDRLVGEALEALGEDTEQLEAPAAVEARLREAFRAAAAMPVAPDTPTRPRAWKWIAAVGAAAGLAWAAYAARRQEPTGPRVEARHEAPAPEAAPRTAQPIAAVSTAPRTVRDAADAERAPRHRRARPRPTVERFEPLYPGDVLADLDAVHLVRLSVPRSALATLGWPARPGQVERDPVEVDAMVGPDGMTRAVRFISQ